jgi:glyoxylase-like metal-dependent hydrolase (beta-lactamase superfamily II)
MQMLVKPMGRGYQTNCYLLTSDDKTIIIDPGIEATQWVIQNAKNPIAILNTHGHFDHTYDDALLQRALKIPVYIRSEDSFMLDSDRYDPNREPCKADVCVSDEELIELEGFRFRFRHFAGHTPGCSMIEFEDRIFSGDFIFDDTIGRYDFPASSPRDMKRSLERFMSLYADDNRPLYPGHGKPTDIQNARKFLPAFIDALRFY